ncbi:hypothetical protein [Vineibacter terrae]|uniref:hypothetical protein n=1 Tax=Vineibacter terrae TaxID=2586908 RepID=UPI002E373BB3|nr:hypothetical protein [Vineibacter terrae]HEX2889246.1 hypothetical protein [Vineibacter terrae]
MAALPSAMPIIDANPALSPRDALRNDNGIFDELIMSPTRARTILRPGRGRPATVQTGLLFGTAWPFDLRHAEDRLGAPNGLAVQGAFLLRPIRNSTVLSD